MSGTDNLQATGVLKLKMTFLKEMAVLGAFLLSVSTAFAGPIYWSINYTGSGIDWGGNAYTANVTGTITTGDLIGGTNGHYTITGFTGTRNGIAMSFCPTQASCDGYGPTGILTTDVSNNYLDVSGLLFGFGADVVALTNDEDGSYHEEYWANDPSSDMDGIDTTLTSFSIMRLAGNPNAVPEPASLALVGLGLLAAGYAGKRRKSAQSLKA